MIKDVQAEDRPQDFLSLFPLARSLTLLSLRKPLAVATLALVGLSACGGDGGGDGVTFLDDSGWVAGQFKPADDFAQQCANPRTGIDPATGSPYPDQHGTGLDERNFLRSWSNETYLWYDEIVDRNPFNYDDTGEYFELLKTDAETASGKPKDKFHFYLPTSEYNSMSQSGAGVSYGATWAAIQSTPPRDLRIAYVEPDSPAADAGLSRGMRIVAIDGNDLINGNNTSALNTALSPSESGASHVFTLRELDGSERDVTLTAAQVVNKPVLEVTRVGASQDVGYILFNDHIATAEAGLIDAVEQLQGQITDLVLDLRYNGGGLLGIASQLAYMIAGPNQINGRVFETLTFNDKLTSENQPIPFLAETQNYSVAEGQPLPVLGLSRVFVLTSGGTCSASESIINALRGVDVEVIQIGSTTCGKPYGFYPQDNCGTTYFTIQFKGENAKGFGDYPDGFSPQNAVSNAGEALPGCDVGDDFNHPLGDPREGRLAAALYYRDNPGSPCSMPVSSSQSKMSASLAAPAEASAVDARVIKSPALQGRVIQR